MEAGFGSGFGLWHWWVKWCESATIALATIILRDICSSFLFAFYFATIGHRTGPATELFLLNSKAVFGYPKFSFLLNQRIHVPHPTMDTSTAGSI